MSLEVRPQRPEPARPPALVLDRSHDLRTDLSYQVSLSPYVVIQAEPQVWFAERGGRAHSPPLRIVALRS